MKVKLRRRPKPEIDWIDAWWGGDQDSDQLLALLHEHVDDLATWGDDSFLAERLFANESEAFTYGLIVGEERAKAES